MGRKCSPWKTPPTSLFSPLMPSWQKAHARYFEPTLLLWWACWLRRWTSNRRLAGSNPDRYTKNVDGGSRSCAAPSYFLIHGWGALEKGTWSCTPGELHCGCPLLRVCRWAFVPRLPDGSKAEKEFPRKWTINDDCLQLLIQHIGLFFKTTSENPLTPPENILSDTNVMVLSGCPWGPLTPDFIGSNIVFHTLVHSTTHTQTHTACNHSHLLALTHIYLLHIH